MRNYARIAAKIRETPWLITPEGLSLVLSIMDARISNPEERISDAMLATKLEEAGAKGSSTDYHNGQIKDGVGILSLYGPIFGKANLMTQLSGATSMEAFRNDLKSMLADDSIKSILLDIDSPGGTSEMIAEAGDEIFAGRDIKPIYAVANNMAGSAAYWLASQATKLYASPSGSVGSIGVYTVHEDQSARDQQQGIKYTFISAAPFKTEGNSHEPLSRQGESYRQELVDELYSDFLAVVARGRGIDTETVESSYGGGRMIPAKRARAAGMVDGISEFDAVLASLTAPEPPKQIKVVYPGSGGKLAQATFGVGGVYHFDYEDGGANIKLLDLESAEWEHSEPGTGSPPTPRLPDHTEPDIASGSRRPDITRGLPNEADEPGAPKASTKKDGGNMNTLEQLFALFEVDNEEALLKAATQSHTESNSLRGDVSLVAQEREFEEKYPDIYAQMKADRDKNLTREAEDFAASVKMFTKIDAEGNITKTNLGLSALASDTVKDTYLKAAKGSLTLDAFADCIKAISTNGTLEYGERGSTREPEQHALDLSSASGIKVARTVFASKVAEIQVSDKLDYTAAIAEASRRYPDLAEAYRATAAA